MFNPKITPGPWKISRARNFHNNLSIQGIGPICADGQDYRWRTHWICCKEEDAFAISLVPELLDMYRSACAVLEASEKEFPDSIGTSITAELHEKVKKLREIFERTYGEV